MAILVSHRLWAQTTPARPVVPTATTKVALINIAYVIKNYDKFKAFNEEMKVAVKPFQDRDVKLKGDGEKLAKEAQDVKTTAERREHIERQLKDLQRGVEDNKTEAQKTVGKKQEEQLRILYMDIRSVVERYAGAHGFDMVLHFNDALTTQDYWNPRNIARKIQADGLMPMYYASSLDISNHIVATLNASYKTAAPAASNAPARTTTPTAANKR
jgi:Skp family chaperone for outer membrane proteins